MTRRFGSVAELRAHLADALDHAERGDTVEVERRGRRFLLTVAPAQTPSKPTAPWFEILEPDLLEAGWTWDYVGESLELRARGAAPPVSSSRHGGRRAPAKPRRVGGR